MNILIVYATLSGSTQTAAQHIQETLSAVGNEVTMAAAEPSLKSRIPSFDVLIFASPSWDDQGNDGQPLPEIRELIESLDARDLQGKKIALAGLGDSAYEHFCGAVDVMEEIFRQKGYTQFAIEHLKIDRYYANADNEQKVKNWATSLGKSLS